MAKVKQTKKQKITKPKKQKVDIKHILNVFKDWYKDNVVNFTKDVKSLVLYEKQYDYYVPIDCFINNGLVLTKYDGLLAVFKITNYDLDYMENFKINNNTDMIKSIMKRLPSGFCLHYETQRKRLTKREFVPRPNSPIPTQIATKERFDLINNGDTFFKTEQYVSLSYTPPVERFKLLKEMFNPMATKKKRQTKEEEWDEFFSQQIIDFENQVYTVMSAYSERLIECKRLNNVEMTNFLYQSINGLQKDLNLKAPPLNYRLDKFLIGIQPKNDTSLKIGDKHCKIITVNRFPDNERTRMFEFLEDLPFEYRVIHRYIPLSKDESMRALKQAKQYHTNKKKSVKQLITSLDDPKNMGNKSGVENKKAVEKIEESEDLVNDIQEETFAFGYYTMTIILEDTNKDILREHCTLIKNKINALGFTAVEENVNFLDSLAGCIPANASENLRKTRLTSDNFVDIMPLSDRLQGSKKHPHFTTEDGSEESLFVTRSAYDLFDFNHFAGDIGHMLCVGVTGGGKSTFINNIALNHLKYDKSKIIFFDLGGSSIPLNICSGGVVYEFGKETISLQPFSRLDVNDSYSMGWALNYTELLISLTDPKLFNVRTSKIIQDALKSLAQSDVKDRTITNLISYIQNDDLKDALRIYSNEGIYGKYLDGNFDNIKDSKFITFELEHIMNDPKIAQPVLSYLIHIITTDLIQKGDKVLIFFDECWRAFKTPIMANFIQELYKTARKKNTAVITATQELNDFATSDIGHTIMTQCLTQVYLANDKAMAMDLKSYKEMNLNLKEITTIANARPKAEYFYKSLNVDGRGSGSILFQLNLTPLELAYVGRSSLEHISVIKSLKQRFGNDIWSINIAWLKYLVKYDSENGLKVKLTQDHLKKAQPIFTKIKEDSEQDLNAS